MTATIKILTKIRTRGPGSSSTNMPRRLTRNPPSVVPSMTPTPKLHRSNSGPHSSTPLLNSFAGSPPAATSHRIAGPVASFGFGSLSSRL